MSQQFSNITIDSVITDYLDESEMSIHRYSKVWHICFRGLEILGLDFFYRVLSVKLPVNANFTVTLPAGYMKWCKVGIFNDNGAIITLQENNNMTSYADLLPDRIEKVNDPQSLWLEGGNGVWNNIWNGGFGYTPVLGVPSGEPFVGEFSVDEENGVIILNNNFQRDYLMLEYVASPNPQAGQDYYIPVQFREALIAWIWWKDKKAVSVKRGQVGISRDLERDFYNQRRQAAARFNPVRKQQIYQASQQLTRQAIKS